MVTSLPVWATIVVNIALNWNIYMFINQQLYYLNSVFGMPAEQAGWIVAPSQILQTVAVTITAALSDKFLNSGTFSKKFTRKGFLSFGLLTQTACLVGLGTIASNAYIAVALMIAACALIGSAFAPFLVNQFDLAPSYAPLILALDNTLGALAGVSGYVVEPLASEGESGWKKAFLIGAGVNIVAFLVFLIFGSVEVQSWARPREEHKKDSKAVLTLDSSVLETDSKTSEVV
uniref:MFS domain-containing protein n=1 Tax=Steinernema glaseri TaxID=37863 RepID=A0A1I7ZKF0_9BILA